MFSCKWHGVKIRIKKKKQTKPTPNPNKKTPTKKKPHQTKHPQPKNPPEKQQPQQQQNPNAAMFCLCESFHTGLDFNYLIQINSSTQEQKLHPFHYPNYLKSLTVTYFKIYCSELSLYLALGRECEENHCRAALPKGKSL